MELLMAKSLTGHDKGCSYVVIGIDGDDCILVDGKRRPMDKPKRKRLKHVQLIKHFTAEIKEQAGKVERWENSSVTKVIKQYLKEEEHCQKQT